MRLSHNIIVLFFYLISLVSGSAFFYRLYRERRSMWTGTLFTVFLLSLFFSSVFTVFAYSQEIQKNIFLMAEITVLVIALSLFLTFFPLVFLLWYFIQGIQILRKEGLKPHNFLSLTFSIGLFLFLFLAPKLSFFMRHPLLKAFSILLSLSITYLLFLAAMYAFSALLNLIHLREKQNFAYIIVLGCGILGEKMTPLLRNRVEKGISLLKKNPQAKLILSGGMGPGESITEAECMKRYVLAQGIPSSKIITEDKSKNTYENLLFSKRIIEEDSSVEKTSIAIVTTSYHVFRALILAKKLHIPCKGFGGKTKWYFTLNAILREFVAYLKISYRTHLRVLVILNGIALLIFYLLNRL